MKTTDLIRKKREGQRLSAKHIEQLIQRFMAGDIPDSQMAAFLMAVYFRGMDREEATDLTLAMVQSGETLDLSAVDGFTVDKHSTGGVGDTTTLVLAPLVAACGGVVAKMSGRELGHTGGTIDKLESIPGLETALSMDRFVAVVNRVRAGVCSQTADLAPADKRIYSLRNRTATVASIPLIASSIMSKKLAAGCDGIVLDVKTGVGAFLQEEAQSVALARLMTAIGRAAGKKVSAFITGMEQPLGFAVGNALEVKEAVATLSGDGPPDLTQLCVRLAGEMLRLGGAADTTAKAEKRILAAIKDGSGLEKLAQMVAAQGGDPETVIHPERLPSARCLLPLAAEREGWVQRLDALAIGRAAKELAGAAHPEARPAAGIVLAKKVGDRVQRGDLLAELHHDGDPAALEAAAQAFRGACRIGDDLLQAPPLFYRRIADGDAGGGAA
jgi:pyrimidine-nucleoside phosphorylase